jgi:hypothetical protein
MNLSSGTLLKRMQVCGNPRCHCASNPAARPRSILRVELKAASCVTARSRPRLPGLGGPDLALDRTQNTEVTPTPSVSPPRKLPGNAARDLRNVRPQNESFILGDYPVELGVLNSINCEASRETIPESTYTFEHCAIKRRLASRSPLLQPIAITARFGGKPLIDCAYIPCERFWRYKTRLARSHSPLPRQEKVDRRLVPDRGPDITSCEAIHLQRDQRIVFCRASSWLRTGCRVSAAESGKFGFDKVPAAIAGSAVTNRGRQPPMARSHYGVSWCGLLLTAWWICLCALPI